MIGGVDTGEAIAFGIVSLVLVSSALASSMVKRTFHAVMFLGVALVAVAALFIVIGSPLIGVVQILVYVGGILTLFIFAVMFVAGDEQEAAPYAPQPRNSAWGILAAWVMFPVLLLWWAFGVTFGVLPKVLPALSEVYVMAANLLPGGYTNWLGQGAGFTAAIVYLVGLVVAVIIAWIGVRHVLYRWSGTRIVGAGVAVVIMGLMVGVALGTQPWDTAGTDATMTAANDLDALVTTMFDGQVVALEVLGVLLTAVMIGALVIARPVGMPDDSTHYGHTTQRDVEESQAASDPSHIKDVAIQRRSPAPAAAPGSFMEVGK